MFPSPRLLSLLISSSTFVIKRFDILESFLGCSWQNCGQRVSWTTMGSNVQFVEPRRGKGNCIADIRYVDSTHIFILLCIFLYRLFFFWMEICLLQVVYSFS